MHRQEIGRATFARPPAAPRAGAAGSPPPRYNHFSSGRRQAGRWKWSLGCPSTRPVRWPPKRVEQNG
eukprot:14804512-Heterocapsa_arctica.AAC.1